MVPVVIGYMHDEALMTDATSGRSATSTVVFEIGSILRQRQITMAPSGISCRLQLASCAANTTTKFYDQYSVLHTLWYVRTNTCPSPSLSLVVAAVNRYSV